MELKKAIMTRRSHRKFVDYHVTDEDIREILEAASLAPSWANTQCWEFIIVRDKELIKKVTETYSRKNPACGCSFESSAIIVALAKKNISGCKNGETRTKFNEWFMYDLGMAMQNMSLMIHDLGLGSVVVGSMNHDECAKLLEVPEDYELVAALPLGKPESFEKPVPPRKKISDFAHLDYFGKNF
ncbi:MAG: nitroreductase family protein [Bacteriovoracaceae bacterium]|nr:nitroreductase family protein [Bacteriovoracaceae bacterium]